MTALEKLKLKVSMSDDGLLSEYLSYAKEIILNRLYPFGIPETVTDVPTQYTNLQVEIAEYLFLKQGAEGETSHSENGVSRIYGSSYVPESMLSQITPYAKIFL